MTNPFIVLMSIAAISAELTASIDGQLGRERIEEILGVRAISSFCSEDRSSRLADIDSETCRQFTLNALELCWTFATTYVPSLSRPFSEYSSLFDDESMEMVKGTITTCVQGEMNRQAFDHEMASIEKEVVVQAPKLLDNWADVISRIQMKHLLNEASLALTLTEFAQSEFYSVVPVSGGRIIASTLIGIRFENSVIEDPPAWTQELERIGIGLVERDGENGRAYGRSNFETVTHEFTYAAYAGGREDNPECHDSFSSLACGGCIVPGTRELTLFVMWHSKALIGSPSDLESGQAAVELDICVQEGLEVARSMTE